MKRIQFYIAALLLSAASPTLATERVHTSTVKFVYPFGNGDFVIGLDSDPSTCSAPDSPKYFWVTVGQNGVTAAGSAKIFASVTAAVVTKLTVTIVFDDATTNCYVNRISLSN